jgi:tRNA threonylcarbamoyladenosine biosynthesis protein TsaB
MTAILAIDTAAEQCSVSLILNGKEQKSYALTELAPRSHAQRLLPMVQEVLAQAGLGLADLDALAFGRGPGSFTGLRIASGFVQGLAFGQDLPVIPVSNLQALAAHVFKTGSDDFDRCLVLVDARMDEIYWAEFARGNDHPELQGHERVDKPEVIADLLGSGHQMPVIGSGFQYAGRLGGIASWPNIEPVPEHPASLVAELALFAWERGESVSAKEAAPIYVRDEVAWKKLPGRE